MSARPVLVALGGVSLLAGLWAGAVRLGWTLPAAVPPAVHGPAMVVGFFGAVISLERAAALRRSWAFVAAPLAVAGSLAAPVPAGRVLVVVAGLVYTATTLVLWRTHGGEHLAVLLLGGACWIVAGVVGPGRALPWYVGFLVATIVGERLELSRLGRPSPRKEPAFRLALAVFAAGLVVGLPSPGAGARLLGVGMAALGAWLFAFDVARRTVRRPGKTRFIALALLGGTAWLVVGGILWVAWGPPAGGLRSDAQLHSLFLGFVLSMVLGHVYLIAPALLGIDVPFRRWAYGVLVLLHATLALRVGADIAGDSAVRQWAGLGNIAAVLAFLAGTVAAVAAPGREMP